MTSEAATNLEAVLLVLEYNQRKENRNVPPPGSVTPEFIERLAHTIGLPVSAAYVRKIETIGKRKIARSQAGRIAIEAL